MGISKASIAGFVALAGPDFTWDGTRGGSRIPSKYLGKSGFRTAFRTMLNVRQGGICPQCGKRNDATMEINHIVSRGPNVKGFFPGNIFVGHATCNAYAKVTWKTIPLSAFARPDCVATEWTPFPVIAAGI